MEEVKIARINELARKSKKVGLSEEERVEQMFLRKEYIAEFKKNLEETIERIVLVDDNGTTTPIKKNVKM